MGPWLHAVIVTITLLIRIVSFKVTYVAGMGEGRDERRQGWEKAGMEGRDGRRQGWKKAGMGEGRDGRRQGWKKAGMVNIITSTQLHSSNPNQ